MRERCAHKTEEGALPSQGLHKDPFLGSSFPPLVAFDAFDTFDMGHVQVKSKESPQRFLTTFALTSVATPSLRSPDGSTWPPRTFLLQAVKLNLSTGRRNILLKDFAEKDVILYPNDAF